MATNSTSLHYRNASGATAPPSATPSPFALPLATPRVAAEHQTNQKLKMLLQNPEQAAAVRAELVPNAMTLADVYHIVAWFKPKVWKALGYGGANKYKALFTWVTALAPVAGLPTADEVTDDEVNAWGLRIERAQKQYSEDLAKATTRSKNARVEGGIRAGWQNTLAVYRAAGNTSLDFNGKHSKLAFRESSAANTPVRRRSVAELLAETECSPPRHATPPLAGPRVAAPRATA